MQPQKMSSEEYWLSSRYPKEMLKCLYRLHNVDEYGADRGDGTYGISDRKLLLFAIACARTHDWTDDTNVEKQLAILPEIESWADGKLNEQPSYPGHFPGIRVFEDEASEAAKMWARADEEKEEPLLPMRADILRDIAGNPYRPITQLNGIWLTPDVVALASAAYEERLPDKTLDPVRLLILADALEEAGCEDDEILFHLRGIVGCNVCEGAGYIYSTPALSSWSPCPNCKGDGLVPAPPHYLGCHVLDTLLGKE